MLVLLTEDEEVVEVVEVLLLLTEEVREVVGSEVEVEVDHCDLSDIKTRLNYPRPRACKVLSPVV